MTDSETPVTGACQEIGRALAFRLDGGEAESA